MTSRIGSLHVDYRASSRGPMAAAMAPQLDRVLASRLGEAIDERLSTLLGDDVEVVVIREVRARATIRPDDWSLESRLLDTMGRASVDAIGAALAAPPDADRIVRFASQAEFIASFIVDLLARSAWARWYFGAFHRYRQPDEASTIAAVLDDNRVHVAGVLGWLARRGHLDELLARLGSGRVRRLVTPRHTDAAAAAARDECGPLFAAGFGVLEALGWIGDDAARPALMAAYLATEPLPPAWSDRRSLTAWLLRFVRFVRVRSGRENAATPGAAGRLPELLGGALDWLDVDWLAPQLQHLAFARSDDESMPAGSSRRVLTLQHERSLDRLADLIRLGRLRVLPHDEADAVVVRLMAALNEADAADEPDRALVAALDRIAGALGAALRSGLDARQLMRCVAGTRGPDRSTPRAGGELADRIEAVSDMGPAAERVLLQLVAATMGRRPAGEPTSAGGLFLLTRALNDVRLHGLAHEAGVAFDALKAALAAWWLDLAAPFDAGAALWIGGTTPEFLRLEASADALGSLEDALAEVLQGQRAFEALPSDATIDPEPRPLAASDAPDVRRSIARIGWMVLRAWSRWLPGIGGSTRPFLVRNCLRRDARLHLTADAVRVELDPAPLDVVIEMAGYFRPIERVSWLQDRTITFSVRRG